MASETTAAATGAVGVVRRDPMAMLPFCGYHMADYWQHWLDMGEKTPRAPKIFNVNWFRMDEKGEFLWPGFGDNLRVLEWILKRAFDEVDARETEIGYLPYVEDINIEGTAVTTETMEKLLKVDQALWREEVANVKAFYEAFNGKVPAALQEELKKLDLRLAAHT
jgi:phosphoenolpyruvate carboxykinase (GTP)